MRVTTYSETELKNSECLGAAAVGGGPAMQGRERQPSFAARSIWMTLYVTLMYISIFEALMHVNIRSLAPVMNDD